MSVAARPTAEHLPELLLPILRRRVPGALAATIRDFRPSTAGFSTETYLFDLCGLDGDATLGLVFRRPPEFAILPGYDLRRQFLVMDRLAESAVPVPRVRWVDTDPGALGTPHLVMDRIDDVASVSDVPPYHTAGLFADTDDAGRATLWHGCVDLIAEVHRVDTARHRLGFLAPGGGPTPAALVAFLRYALGWAYDGEPLHPTFTRALSWLDAHPRSPDHVGLCWGDSRMSNVLYRPGDLAPVAALDWEIAYLGDTTADLAWLLMTDWISSPLPDHAPAPGTPTRAETLDRYEHAAGRRVGDLRFADVCAPLLLAVALVRLNRRFALEDIDLAGVCAARVEYVLDGD